MMCWKQSEKAFQDEAYGHLFFAFLTERYLITRSLQQKASFALIQKER